MKNGNNNFYKAHAEFFLMEMKAHCDEGGVRILLGDNKDDGVVILRPIRCQSLGVRILD